MVFYEGDAIMLKLRISMIAAVAGLALASGAQASTIKMSSFVYTPAQSVSIPGYTGGAGAFKAIYINGLSNEAFTAYCIDTAQHFSWNSAFTITQTTTSALFGASKSLAIGQLYTQHYASVSNAQQSAAFQLSLWEIIKETGSSYSLTAGTFKATSPNASVISLAQGWLSGLSGTGNAYILTAYTSPTYQDQLRATLAPTTVPVPTAAWLLGSGLLGLIGVARRKVA